MKYYQTFDVIQNDIVFMYQINSIRHGRELHGPLSAVYSLDKHVLNDCLM